MMNNNCFFKNLQFQAMEQQGNKLHSLFMCNIMKLYYYGRQSKCRAFPQSNNDVHYTFNGLTVNQNAYQLAGLLSCWVQTIMRLIN